MAYEFKRGDQVKFCSAWRDMDIDRDGDEGTVVRAGLFSVEVRFDSNPEAVHLLTSSEVRRITRRSNDTKGTYD